MGPNTPVANGTLLGSIQAQGDYFANVSSSNHSLLTSDHEENANRECAYSRCQKGSG